MMAASALSSNSSSNSSSNGHQHQLHPSCAIDIDPATASVPADDELTTALPDTVKMELIARGKMLLERYQQRQKTRGDSFSLGHNHHYDYDYKQLQQHVQPPPQFYSDISLLSSTSSSGGGFQLSSQYNGTGKHESNGGSNNINNSSSESLVGLNTLSFVDPTTEPSSPLGSWSEFLSAQLQSAQLLDTIDEQLQRLTEFVEDEFQTESFVVQLCRSVGQLLQQKRAAEAAIEKFIKELGPPVFVETDDTEEMGKKADAATDATMNGEEPVNDRTRKKALKWLTQPYFRELVDVETAELQRELDESKLFIDELKSKVHALKTEASSQDTGRLSSESGDEVWKMENCLQEKEELVVSLRTSLENVAQDHKNLELELQRSVLAKQQLEKVTADKEALLQRAYTVKAMQLDQLCHTVELPAPWQQVVDENGIISFQQQGNRASISQLEDPRVPVALSLYDVGTMKKKRSPSLSLPSPRSASEKMEQIQYEEKQAERASLSCSGGSEYSRHSNSVDLTGCEDISVPPDDGCKHKINDFATPLPEGWEMRATAAGSVFFVNRHTNVTTWKDPREEEGNEDGGNSKKTHHGRRVEELRVKIPSERKQNESSHENTVTSNSPPGFPEEDDVQYFDVVFKERGPIGIHFQANNPDAGATVRRLLPGTAAIDTGILRPFDRLIAVNQNPVDTASFRHVMILLQGGLRPLTLTFKRDLNASRRTSGSSATGQQDGQDLGDADLDEEVVLDSEMEQDRHDGTTSAAYGERRRSSKDLLNRRHSNQDVTGGRRNNTNQHHHQDAASRPQNASAGTIRTPSLVTASVQHEDNESVADKIITNLFSFFWTPPEPAITGEVQTV